LVNHTLDGIKVNGLQGLKAMTTIDNVDVTCGTADVPKHVALHVSLPAVSIFNPSNLELSIRNPATTTDGG
jgi:hypothetical protein